MITRVDQIIQGVLMTREQATALGVDPGTAGLRIVRHYYVKEQLIELTIGLHPSSHFTYSTSFQLDR
jgi:DNA-binding GntR family transcriptional regulator